MITDFSSNEENIPKESKNDPLKENLLIADKAFKTLIEHPTTTIFQKNEITKINDGFSFSIDSLVNTIKSLNERVTSFDLHFRDQKEYNENREKFANKLAGENSELKLKIESLEEKIQLQDEKIKSNEKKKIVSRRENKIARRENKIS